MKHANTIIVLCNHWCNVIAICKPVGFLVVEVTAMMTSQLDNSHTSSNGLSLKLLSFLLAIEILTRLPGFMIKCSSSTRGYVS